METALLIDFGSTYTKVAMVDLDQERLIGRAQAPSTVDSDMFQGLFRALQILKGRTKFREEEITVKLACSSAAGGLRMVAMGLIHHLTAEAANRAALGAGAKVIKVFGKELNDRTVPELEVLNPDIILLAGGVDGGNHEVIVHNARRIAFSKVRSPVIIAGNVDAQEEVEAIFRQAGQETYPCDNVMPRLNALVVEPARARIQEVFIGRIVRAKGLNRATEYVGQVIMPTPLAVLKMTELLAQGTASEPGLGEVAVIDIGGATTDVHSVGFTKPNDSEAYVMDLAEPYLKRTVEGDLGLRVNAESIIQAVAEHADDLLDADHVLIGHLVALVAIEAHVPAKPSAFLRQIPRGRGARLGEGRGSEGEGQARSDELLHGVSPFRRGSLGCTGEVDAGQPGFSALRGRAARATGHVCWY